MSNTYWRALAIERWPGQEVTGTGRWALKSERGGIFLFETKERAVLSGPFYNSKVYDLRPTPVPTRCREIGYE